MEGKKTTTHTVSVSSLQTLHGNARVPSKSSEWCKDLWKFVVNIPLILYPEVMFLTQYPYTLREVIITQVFSAKATT